MRMTPIEWAIGVVFTINIVMSLLGILFPEGTSEERQEQSQTQSAPAPSTNEIKSDWK